MAGLLQVLPYVLGGIVLLVMLGLIAVAVSSANQDADPLADRLADYVSDTHEVTANLEAIEMSVPFTQRVLLPLMQQIARFTTQFTPQETLQKTQKQLTLAGDPKGLTPSILWMMRFVAMIGMAILMVLLLSRRGTLFALVGLVGGGAVGFMLPQMWLSSKITRRQQGAIKALPDALDLMSICVEAGLGFDQAMSKVFEKWDNEMALAFGRVIREIQLGKTRREALRNMSESLDVADVTSFVSAIIQADQLGVSITKVLRIQSEQMRIKRRQRAEEEAQKTPNKMAFPLVLLIFPSIALVLMGPGIVQAYRALILKQF